jgi:hypothetical protein
MLNPWDLPRSITFEYDEKYSINYTDSYFFNILKAYLKKCDKEFIIREIKECLKSKVDNIQEQFEINKEYYVMKQKEYDIEIANALKEILDCHIIISLDETFEKIEQMGNIFLNMLKRESKRFNHVINKKKHGLFKSDSIYSIYLYTVIPELLDYVDHFIYIDSADIPNSDLFLYVDSELYTGGQLNEIVHDLLQINEDISLHVIIPHVSPIKTRFTEDTVLYDGKSNHANKITFIEGYTEHKSIFDCVYDSENLNLIKSLAYLYRISLDRYAFIPEQKTPDIVSVSSQFLHNPIVIIDKKKPLVEQLSLGISLIPGCARGHGNKCDEVKEGNYCPNACYTNNLLFAHSFIKRLLPFIIPT